MDQVARNPLLPAVLCGGNSYVLPEILPGVRAAAVMFSGE